MAERRVVRSAPAGAAEPCAGLRFPRLDVVDEFTRECLAIGVERRLKATDVPADLFVTRGVPGFIRPDNGGGFTAVAGSPGLEQACRRRA